MTLLLDTQIYLWFLADSRRLTVAAREMIDAADRVLVSAASVWEVGLKVTLRKLEWSLDEVVEGIEASGFAHLPVIAIHAARVGELPPVHRDPFDRLLVAQAAVEGTSLLTADALLARYGAHVRVV